MGIPISIVRHDAAMQVAMGFDRADSMSTGFGILPLEDVPTLTTNMPTLRYESTVRAVLLSSHLILFQSHLGSNNDRPNRNRKQ